MAGSLPKLQPSLLQQLPYEVQEWIRQLQNLASSNSGTVTSVSVATANGVSGSVANPTTTPALTLSLGAITPSSVAASGTVGGSNLSGTNTGDVNDATITTTDVTTNNVSTTKHGWAPKSPNDATKYLDGTGAYTVPAGSGGGGFTLGTATSLVGLTSLDFTGITAKYIIINVIGAGCAAGWSPRFQLGDSGGIEISGYTSGDSYIDTGGVCLAEVGGGVGFDFNSGLGGGGTFSGQMRFCLEDSATFRWTGTGNFYTSSGLVVTLAGWKATSATTDRVRFTTTSGSTFNQGVVNVAYSN